jgi:hypothetical protein
MDANLFYATELPQLVCLAVAFTAGMIAAGAYWHRQRAGFAMARSAPGQIIYNDVPTVRVVDPQRVDRRRKIVRLAVGEYLDLLETPAGFEPRFRVTLKSISASADAAHIAVGFGSTRVSCGPLVQEQSENEFLVPRAHRDDPRSCVFHYYESGSSLDFMRIKVRALDTESGTAELDVMQVASHWPSGEG